MGSGGPRGGLTLHRFFLPAESFGSTDVSFTPEAARQLDRVLRCEVGDRVIALDGSGDEIEVELRAVGKLTTGAIVSRRRNHAEPSIRLSLYMGLLKGSKLELVLQKCTEVGVSRFVPVVTQRAVPSEPSESRHTRFTAIVREAAEQSRRGIVPTIDAPLSWEEALADAETRGPAIVLWEEERTNRFDSLNSIAHSAAGLLIGPEGGLTPAEVESARGRGAHIVSLGPRILRAETAAIVGSALLLQRAGAL